MITHQLDTDEFDIDDQEVFRLAQLEEECGCEVIAGIDYGHNLGNYLYQTLNSSISYDRLKEILDSKTGKVLSPQDVGEILSQFQTEMLAPNPQPISTPKAKSA